MNWRYATEMELVDEAIRKREKEMTDHRDYGDESYPKPLKKNDFVKAQIGSNAWAHEKIKKLEELPRPGGIIDRIDWYVQCLKDFADRKPVRGLAEAKSGYDSAMEELKALWNKN